MVRVGDKGKYKVGDKLIIFVRILRRHIMVRVGGGWQELSEFLRAKDPCRSRPLAPHHTQSSLHHNNHNHYNNNNNSQQQSFYSSRTSTPSGSPSLVSLSLLANNHNHNHNPNGHQYQHRAFKNANHNNETGYQSNNNTIRSISGSASMSWLSSHNSNWKGVTIWSNNNNTSLIM